MPPLNAGPLLVQRDPEGALGGLCRGARDLAAVIDARLRCRLGPLIPRLLASGVP